MKKFLIAGNWKSNKNTIEAKEWLLSFKSQIANHEDQLNRVSIILFLPFTLLYPMKLQIDLLKLPILLGAQDVSPFEDGAYTGEISARMIKELAEWVTIGHSERRTHFHESEEILTQKVSQAKKEGLRIIYGVPDSQTSVPTGVDVVAYEPPSAIGVGKTAEDSVKANEVIEDIKLKQNISADTQMIYGGSVSPENIASFVAERSIDGILSGRSSLDHEKFLQLITNASN